MDGRSLRYFIEVVRQGGFTRAAEVLNVTQPAISKMIRQLEENLGTPLLIRRSRSIELTEAGRLTFTKGLNILEGMSSLRADVEALKGDVWGTLRLGIPPRVGAAFFARVLGDFRRRYPLVDVSVVEFGGKKIRDMVLSGHVDIGVTLTPYDASLFEGMVFANEELALVVPAEAKWQGRDAVDLRDLADEAFVTLTEDYLTGDRFREACRVHGFVPREVGHSGQLDFLIAMVEAGIGITFMPKGCKPMIRPHRVRLLSLSPTINWQLALIWRRGDCVVPAAVSAWVGVTRDVLLSAS